MYEFASSSATLPTVGPIHSSYAHTPDERDPGSGTMELWYSLVFLTYSVVDISEWNVPLEDVNNQTKWEHIITRQISTVLT